MDRLKQQMHGQSDEYIRDIFQKVIQPVIKDKVLPLVDEACLKFLSGLNPKDKVTVNTFKKTMAAINENILEKLFMPVEENDEQNQNQD